MQGSAEDTSSGELGVSDEELEKIQGKYSEFSSIYADLFKSSEGAVTRKTVDDIEDALAEEGYPVINSDEIYPAYLENAEGIYHFWDSVKNGGDGETDYWGVSSSGELYYQSFQIIEGQAYSISASAVLMEDGEFELTYAQKRDVLHWDMTYNDDFYYQDLPTDWHWDAATLLRLNPADRTLYDLTAKYILPIGYYNINFFLCDWTTSDFGEMSFNDLFEPLYLMENGQAVSAEAFEYADDPDFYSLVPAKIFEDTILPYFDLSLTAFRKLALYDAEKESYPWQELTASNVVYYPSLIPEVMKAKENTDGSLTLTVNVMCLDKKTDCLFIHEVTVLPSEGGSFQYLSNQIVHQGEQELPSTQPRLAVQEATS